MRRGPNPMHGYLASNPARTLCNQHAPGRRRVLVSLESVSPLEMATNPCDECLHLARKRQEEFRAALERTDPVLTCTNCGETYRESQHVIEDRDPGLCLTCVVGG